MARILQALASANIAAQKGTVLETGQGTIAKCPIDILTNMGEAVNERGWKSGCCSYG